MSTELDVKPWERRGARFGRDLVVNVAGNLVTAAILYLLAVAGGYLTKNPTLILIAIIIVVACTAGGVVGRVRPKTNPWVFLVAGFIVGLGLYFAFRHRFGL